MGRPVHYCDLCNFRSGCRRSAALRFLRWRRSMVTTLVENA